MFWPDLWFLGLLWEAFLDLGSENARARGLIVLFLLIAIPVKLFQLTLYQAWQRKLLFQPHLAEGGGINEVGRVAWPVGVRDGLFQRIWFRHGWLCRKYPSVWRFGYVLSAVLALGGIITLTMDFWAFFYLMATDAEPGWVLQIKYNTGWWERHRPWPVTMLVGLAGRFLLAWSALWFAKTFVVKGFLGSYYFWPGDPPATLEAVEWWDPNKLPFGYKEFNQMEVAVSAGNTVNPVVLYVRPRGAWFSFLLSPQPWVMQDLPHTRRPAYTYLGESHGEVKQHPETGRYFMVPSGHFLSSQDDWLAEARELNVGELDLGKELVEKGAETSAEQKVRKIYEGMVQIEQHNVGEVVK